MPGAGGAPSAPNTNRPHVPQKIEVVEKVMGTELVLIAYTSPTHDEAATRAALRAAYRRFVEIERLMSEWRADSEISRLNAAAGRPVPLSSETLGVLEKSLWAAQVSDGAFDITFAPLSEVWKFGDAAESPPRVPSAEEVKRRIAHVDYRRIRLDKAAGTATLGAETRIGLGGIAKGYAVDQAAKILRSSGLSAFLVQAGGDLYGAGTKPDGSPWVSGIQDPRGARGSFFAAIELTDHAFSTAGDYARAYIVEGKRYHHILDPKTGYPARLCRSVTIWAPDATVADAVDDAVFILGPKRGLELIEALDGVGAVIVDAHNKVWVSKRLSGKVRIVRQPTDGV